MKRRKFIREIPKSEITVHKPKENLWEKFLNYFEKIEVGKKFSRSSMLSIIYGIDVKVLCLHSKSKKMTTVDNYRAILTKCGIVEATEKPGVYIKVRNLPHNIKYSHAVKAAYDTSWRKWFMTLEDLLKTYGGVGEDG